jgi:AraC-like DNA-binding protein
LENRVNYLAVRFQPGSFLHFFDSPANYCADQIMPLEMLSGKREHELIERLMEENHIRSKIELLESCLTRLLMRSNKSDPAVTIAVNNVLKCKGDVRISWLSRIANCSQRQLCRKFCTWVGVSPKSFCNIIRFQSTLRILHARSKCNLLSIALDGGYYDQSHFIHEFNSYFGLTPSEFIARNNF